MLVALLSAPGVVMAMLLPAGPASAMGKVVCDVSGQPTV